MPYNDNNADIISMLSEENVDRTIESIKALVENTTLTATTWITNFRTPKGMEAFQFVFKAA